MNSMEIQWNKRGRPRKDGTACTTEYLNKPFTRSELYLVTDPVDALATAVIKQWIEDGKPKCDMSVWFKIHEECSNRR